MTTTRPTKVLAAALAASTLTSCGGSILDAAEERDRRGLKRESVLQKAEGGYEPASAKEKRGTDKKRAGTAGSSTPSGGSGDGTRVQRSAPRDDRDKPDSSAEQGREPTESRPAVACAGDMTGDLESSGPAPSYADLQRGCLREDGEQVALEATTVGPVPARMPDRNTHLAITFAIERPSGATTYVTAEASEQGWTASLTHGRRQVALPTPVATGQQLRVTVPAAELGSAPVRWRYESSWLRSTLTSTAYAFDDAPNGGGSATFDRR